MTQVRAVLAASLLLNVFAVGAVGGGIFMLSQPTVWRSLTSRAPGPVGSAGLDLPEADHEAFRETMRRVFDDSQDLIRTARESRETAARLFGALEAPCGHAG